MGNFTQDEKRRLLRATEEIARLERQKQQRRLLKPLGFLALPVVLGMLGYRLGKAGFVFIKGLVRK